MGVHTGTSISWHKRTPKGSAASLRAQRLSMNKGSQNVSRGHRGVAALRTCLPTAPAELRLTAKRAVSSAGTPFCSRLVLLVEMTKQEAPGSITPASLCRLTSDPTLHLSKWSGRRSPTFCESEQGQ